MHKTPERALLRLVNTKKCSQKEYQKKWMKNIYLQIYSLANILLNSKTHTVYIRVVNDRLDLILFYYIILLWCDVICNSHICHSKMSHNHVTQRRLYKVLE